MTSNILKNKISSIIFFFILCLINILFLIHNKSWIFNFNILNLYGDQHLYIGLSSNIVNFNFIPHIYSVGFPILLIPFILFLNTTDWIEIAKYLVPVQSLIIFPLTGTIIFNIYRKTKSRNLYKFFIFLIAIAFLAYELIILYISKDPLPFHLFFGLIPYSETFAIFLLVLVYYLLIKKDFIPTKKIFLFIGILVSFLISIRIIIAAILAPIFFLSLYCLYKKRIKCFLFFYMGLLIGYLPQLFYNLKAYHKFFYSGYNWYWEKVQYPLFKDQIYNLYGQHLSSLFSLRYLEVNMLLLWSHYIHYILLATINIALIIWVRKKIKNLSMPDIFFIISNICSFLYIAIYLSYWWSLSVDCIDRFLMPIAFFSLINLYYSLRLLGANNDVERSN